MINYLRVEEMLETQRKYARVKEDFEDSLRQFIEDEYIPFMSCIDVNLQSDRMEFELDEEYISIRWLTDYGDSGSFDFRTELLYDEKAWLKFKEEKTEEYLTRIERRKKKTIEQKKKDVYRLAGELGLEIKEKE